jgi:CheY-like chemotaxis protein
MSHPKKRVLLCCADEQMLSILTLVLESKTRYHVAPVPSPHHAVQALTAQMFEVAIVIEQRGDHGPSERLVNWVKTLQPECRVLLDLQTPKLRQTLAERVILHDFAELLETLKQMCTRKRGPRTSRRIGPLRGESGSWGLEPMPSERQVSA